MYSRSYDEHNNVECEWWYWHYQEWRRDQYNNNCECTDGDVYMHDWQHGCWITSMGCECNV